jgi:hypothetical protein
MSRITSECPTCGSVALGIDDLIVVVCPAYGFGWYLFDCHGCVRQVVTAVPITVVDALSHLCIPVWTVPAEVAERVQAAGWTPPLGTDDLLDLMLDLRSHDDLAALTGR